MNKTEWPFGLYLHIPYCRSRCRYCDFHTQPASSSVPEAYVDALLRSWAHHAPTGADGRPWQPTSVYFGGGTPGLLAPEQVARLLDAVQPAEGAEITLEANPQPSLPLAGWRAAGVNRLSLGVQSALDASLRRLGRLHSAADARDTLRQATAAGFSNISCDIMLALPAYTEAEFDATLALAREGGATHLSAYLLKVEPGSAFGKAPPAGLPDEDAAAGFYEYAHERMEAAGYHRYEISNWARPGHEGQHNLLYWNCADYLGLGPAAHSCLHGQRFSFAPDTAAFLQDAAPPAPEGPLTASDYIMLRLRLGEGLDEDALEQRFGHRLHPRQHQLMQQLTDRQLALRTPHGWALTTRGLLVQNSILAALLAE